MDYIGLMVSPNGLNAITCLLHCDFLYKLETNFKQTPCQTGSKLVLRRKTVAHAAILKVLINYKRQMSVSSAVFFNHEDILFLIYSVSKS
jgi:hypothetical protein